MSSVFDNSFCEPTSSFPLPVRRSKSRNILAGLKRRLAREQRRRKIGRAYDMALEIERFIPTGSDVLDVGCGNGYIAHHLCGLLRAKVLGIDVADTNEAAIDYRRYDGAHFPLADQSVDAVLLCYVLHHAEDALKLLLEAKRVVRGGGVIVIYEDIPATFWDQAICRIHNRQWQNLTGPCTFRNPTDWENVFRSLGFELNESRCLSRWRNLTHPVRRSLFVIRSLESAGSIPVSSPPLGSRDDTCAPITTGRSATPPANRCSQL